MQYYCIQCRTSIETVASDVKRPASTYRRTQAEATKWRIADAARDLFARDGYGATSMEAIAREAGVGSRTVYSVYGTKREILNAICDRWLEQAEARRLAADILAEPDAQTRLRGAARWLTVLYSTDFDVVRILDSAMDEDAETRALLRGKLRGRNRVMDSLIASVETDLAVPLADAQATFRALAAPGVYGELVIDAGWPVARFERWVESTLLHHLVATRRPGTALR
jgi:AcrR family transcriptional regulator